VETCEKWGLPGHNESMGSSNLPFCVNCGENHCASEAILPTLCNASLHIRNATTTNNRKIFDLPKSQIKNTLDKTKDVPNDTGLGTSYFFNIYLSSYHPFKLNAIRTLIHRPYPLYPVPSSFFTQRFNSCSSYFLPMATLFQFFHRLTSQILNKVNSPKPTVSSVPKLFYFFSDPYYN